MGIGRVRGGGRAKLSAVVVVGGSLLATPIVTGTAWAQARVAPPGGAQAPGGPAAQAGGGNATGAAQTVSTQIVPVPADLLQGKAGGVTAEQVGQRAAATSYSAKASEEQLRAAAARVDAAWVQFFPRVSGTARYTRNSDFTSPSLLSSDDRFRTIATPSQNVDEATGQLRSSDPALLFGPKQPNISFPKYLDNYFLQANVIVPLSDYFLRINQNYSAASHSEKAARWDIVGARAKASADGRVAYYTWMRGRGQLVVALQALNDRRTHLNDVRNQFTVGNANKADVLRAETAVAEAEYAVDQSRHFTDFAETQVRVAMHLAANEQPGSLVPGEGIEDSPPAFQGTLPQLTDEGLGARPEVKSIDENALALHRQASAARASQLPAVSAFGDAIYANPNPRYFSAEAQWFPTWDVGVQATWSPNDIGIGGANGADLEHRARATEAQRQATRDGIAVEVAQAWQGLKDAESALVSRKRQLTSAQEAYRVARELFNNGRGTSTTLTDAETELTQARIAAVYAAVDARIARVRMEHAVGRDAVANTP